MAIVTSEYGPSTRLLVTPESGTDFRSRLALSDDAKGRLRGRTVKVGPANGSSMIVTRGP